MAGLLTFQFQSAAKRPALWGQRTSGSGNGNHSVSLPTILIKIKVDQMIPSSYISSLFGLFFMIMHLISYFHECTALFWG